MFRCPINTATLASGSGVGGGGPAGGDGSGVHVTVTATVASEPPLSLYVKVSGDASWAVQYPGVGVYAIAAHPG